jgi:hypothetical protein
LEVLGLWGERIPDIMAFSRSDYLFMSGGTEKISDDIMKLYNSPDDVVPCLEAFKAGVLRPIYSMHANLPCARSKEKDLSSMRAVFFILGPDIVEGERADRINLVDVSPTLSHILSIAPPRNCEGRIVREAFK